MDHQHGPSFCYLKTDWNKNKKTPTGIRRLLLVRIEISWDPARVDADHAHLRVLSRDVVGHLQRGGFGRWVGARARPRRHVGEPRARVDQHRLGSGVGEEGLEGVQGRDHIGLEDLGESLGAVRGHRAHVAGQAGVGDEHVDLAADFPRDRVECRRRLSPVEEVDGLVQDSGGGSSSSSPLGGDSGQDGSFAGLELVSPPSEDGDGLGAGLRKCDAGGLADSRASARDDDVLPSG